MNSLEEIIMEEISSLPEMQLIDVLGFIRYLKSESHGNHELIEQWLEGAQKSIHARTAELKITSEDIETQIKKKAKHTEMTRLPTRRLTDSIGQPPFFAHGAHK